MSKLWAHLATLLALIGAVGTDAGAFHLPGDLGLAVNAIAGLLGVAHLVAPSTVGAAVADVDHVAHTVTSLVDRAAASYKAAAVAAKTPAATPADVHPAVSPAADPTPPRASV